MKVLDQEKLNTVVDRLVNYLQPERIYLYGSHAYGNPQQDSDIDLLVIVAVSDISSYKRERLAYRALRGLYFPADIKVSTNDEIRDKMQWFNSVEKAALEKGKLLYDISGQ